MDITELDRLMAIAEYNRRKADTAKPDRSKADTAKPDRSKADTAKLESVTAERSSSRDRAHSMWRHIISTYEYITKNEWFWPAPTKGADYLEIREACKRLSGEAPQYRTMFCVIDSFRGWYAWKGQMWELFFLIADPFFVPSSTSLPNFRDLIYILSKIEDFEKKEDLKRVVYRCLEVLDKESYSEARPLEGGEALPIERREIPLMNLLAKYNLDTHIELMIRRYKELGISLDGICEESHDERGCSFENREKLPIHYAMKYRNKRMVEAILPLSLKVLNKKDRQGHTPLYYAMWKAVPKPLSIGDHIFLMGTPHVVLDGYERHPYERGGTRYRYKTVLKEHSQETVKEIYGRTIDVVNIDRDLLRYVLRYNNPEDHKTLIENSIDIQEQDYGMGITSIAIGRNPPRRPIDMVVQCGSVDQLKLLFEFYTEEEQMAALFPENTGEWSPLYRAVYMNHIEMVNEILSRIPREKREAALYETPMGRWGWGWIWGRGIDVDVVRRS